MAWVRTIQPQEAQGEVLEAYREITGEARPERVGNVIKSTSIRPRTMRDMVALNNAVNFQNHDSGLTRLQREMIAAVVSATLECRYWVTAHAEMAVRAGGTVQLAQQLKTNYRKAALEPKELAMLEFAELLTVQPANVVEEDIKRLLQLGWTDEDVVDIVHQTALFNYMTRVADGLGVELDERMLEAEQRDKVVVDTSKWGKRTRDPQGAV